METFIPITEDREISTLDMNPPPPFPLQLLIYLMGVPLEVLFGIVHSRSPTFNA